jgi:2',3'-cyclic-nucleotide 2'-phosphodiesterase (5'-nucleotidase family)
VNEIRESKKEVLLLDAGDLFFKKYAQPAQDQELKMATAKAHLMLESLNVMGYDALGIGDDDLTLGKEFLMDLSKRQDFLSFLQSLTENQGNRCFNPF